MPLFRRDPVLVPALVESRPPPPSGNTPAQYEATIDLLVERFAELELQLEDWNWARMVAEGDREFSRDGLDRIIALSRIMFIKNPLIGRAVRVMNFYVWGQGVNIRARDTDINDLIQAFIDNRGNKRSVFGHEARKLCEQTLRTEGNLFFSLFPNRMTGMVGVRTIPVDEIRDIVCNPDDRAEPWYYRRDYVEVRLNHATGNADLAFSRTVFYPDWEYQPAFRPPELGGHPVRWDTPVMHTKVGGLQSMRFGVPQTYAANDWARAYKGFLEDFVSVAKSLSRLAWEMTSKRKTATGNAARLGSTVGSSVSEHNPSPVAGSTFVHAEGVDMKPINKAGATIDSEQGKAVRLQVGAATDLPDTILSGDPDQGNLATAKTLDRPTELAMIDRQTLWASIYEDLINFYLDWCVRAPAAPLTGVVRRADPTTEIVELADETDRTVEVTFPPILEADIAELAGAITAAQATGFLPPKTTLQLFLSALGVDDADEIIEQAEELGLLDGTASSNAGQALIDRYRAGQDPADAFRGRPAPAPAPTPVPASA